MSHDLDNTAFVACSGCKQKPSVFVNLSYFDMITCRCACGEKDYPTVISAQDGWNKDNGEVSCTPGTEVQTVNGKIYGDHPDSLAPGRGGFTGVVPPINSTRRQFAKSRVKKVKKV
jgi:hypothetical protein